MTPTQLENAIGHAAFALWWRGGHLKAYLTDPELALVLCHLRESNRRAVVSLARAGFEPAHEILCSMASFLTEIGDPLPLWLQEHIVLDAKNGEAHRKRGRDPWDNFLRDAAIGQAVEMVSRAHHLRPTRNAGTTAECGCSIVTKALAMYFGKYMTEANVVAIWRRTVDRELLLWQRIDAREASPTSGRP